MTKKLILSAVLLFSLTCYIHAQDKERIIIDETTLTDLKNSFKITSCNDHVSSELVKKYGTTVKSYTVKNKVDRSGIYQEYAFHFPVEMKAEVEKFLTNIKPVNHK